MCSVEVPCSEKVSCRNANFPGRLDLCHHQRDGKVQRKQGRLATPGCCSPMVSPVSDKVCEHTWEARQKYRIQSDVPLNFEPVICRDATRKSAVKIAKQVPFGSQVPGEMFRKQCLHLAWFVNGHGSSCVPTGFVQGRLHQVVTCIGSFPLHLVEPTQVANG